VIAGVRGWTAAEAPALAVGPGAEGEMELESYRPDLVARDAERLKRSVAAAEGGENIVRTALEAFGTIDIVINNAGILRDKSFLKMEPENWQIVLDVHLNGAYHVSRPAFAVMKEKGYGRILMTTSAAGLYGNFGQTNYTAAKMGLVGLMNTLKLEGEKYNIKVNTVAPLATTRLTEDVLPPDFAEQLDPELVTPLVLFLCSGQCGDTGLILNAGMGFFNRAGVVSAPGAYLGEEDKPPGVGDIHRNWEKIASLSGAREYANANEALMDMLSGPKEPPEERPAEIEAQAQESAGNVDIIFDRMPDRFQPDAAEGIDVVFQFNISGRNGGDWYIIIQEDTCKVKAGQHENPVTTLKMEAGDFIDLVEGSLPAMQAYTSGKLKIKGDLMKSQLIQKLFKFG